jgi:hypothetical protein
MPLSHRHVPLAMGALVITSAAIGTLTSQTRVAAQVPQTRPIQPERSISVSSQPVQNLNLQSLLDKVLWEPASRGPLLIVAPETTFPLWTKPRFISSGEVSYKGPSQLPKPDASGNYRLPDLGEYFGRQARVAGKSLTVFVPTMMTVLASPLPKPDPYAGMRSNEKLRLLQSTLTPAQWRTLGSPNGIGIGDLDRKQRELFLSLLPEPFVVQPVKRNETGQRMSGGRVEDAVTLSPAQRQNVRISLRRRMDWSFMTVGSTSGNSRIGVGEDDGEKFELRGIGFGSNFNNRRDTLFGVPIIAEVPNRLKPGQLPFDWSALNAPVSLEGASTVGDLIKRIAAQTHVELYCDSRYANLKVYTRSSGGSVRSGDLLQALCWAVTGTFRKVGASTFVMTDDLEGLGTRHAQLQAWASANAALAEKRGNDIEEAIAKTSIGDYVTWADNDPMHPDDALARKIEEHRKTLATQSAPPTAPTSQRANPTLIVPVTELPASAQDLVRRQLESHAKMRERQQNEPFFQRRPEANPELQTDRVAVNVKVRAAFVVPDIGVVSAQGYSSGFDAEQSLNPVPSRQAQFSGRSVFGTPPSPGSLTIPPDYKVRALLVAPRNTDEAARAITAAKKFGFNQVWLDIPPALPKELLSAAIAKGKENGISVGAVVRLLRSASADDTTDKAGDANPLPIDRNLLGETTREYAARRATAPFTASPFTAMSLPPKQESERLLARGDWLLPDSPSFQATTVSRVAAIAETPGLAGIVLRDTAAPGYDGTPMVVSPFDSRDGAEQMGYTETMRLAFLRESGIDPIDLSPLQQGRLNLPFGGSYAPFLEFQLPFFPDQGANSASYRINGQSADPLGAKNGMARWSTFRAAKSETFTQSIVKAIRTRVPELSLWIQRGGDSLSGNSMSSFFDSDAGEAKAESTASIPPTASPTIPVTGPPHTSSALVTVRSAPLSGEETGPSTASTEAINRFHMRLSSVLNRVPPGWGGIAFDLTELPVDRALPLLDILRP